MRNAWPRGRAGLGLTGATVAAAIALRLAGIGWGLPHTFNADEPHLVQLALSFGGGSLRPYLFKYPTLWPYLLSFCYGLYFLAWSGFGLRRGVAEFIGLFVEDPSGFYLIGRLLSTLFSLLGALLLLRAGSERLLEPDAPERPVPWASLLLAFSPVLIELAHSCKPDSLMFFFACAAWHAALRLYREGGRGAHWACGACAGLALSTQYTAFPLLALLPLAHGLAPARAPLRWLAEGSAAAAAAFLAGSPYALLDAPLFLGSLKDLAEFSRLNAAGWSRLSSLSAVGANLADLARLGPVAGLSALAGATLLVRREPRLSLLLLGPVALYALMLSSNPEAGWQRYLLGAFPGLALLASRGLEWARRRGGARAAALLAAAALGPGLQRSALMDRDMRLPDTRSQAAAWIEANIPAGATLLLDSEHASPRLRMAREQALELALKARRAGSPRARLYEAAAATHPGGGYRLYRIARSARDLGSGPAHVRLSQAGSPMLDVSPGLAALRGTGVHYVVTSSYGTNPERAPQSVRFLRELAERGERLRTFRPLSGRQAGPVLEIFRVRS